MWTNSTTSYIHTLASVIIEWRNTAGEVHENYSHWCSIPLGGTQSHTRVSYLHFEPSFSFGVNASLLQALVVATFLYCYATLFTFHLPAYLYRRASRYLLLHQDNIARPAKLWNAVLCPLVDQWKAVVVLSALFASSILGLIQASLTLSQDRLALSIAYLTLIGVLVTVLLSTVLLLHVSAREHDDMFIMSWANEMKYCCSNGIWNIWTVVALPLVWAAWTSIGFVTIVLLQIWRQPTTYVPETPNSVPGLTDAIPSPLMQKSFPTFAVGLSAALGTGILHIFASVATFWKIANRCSKTKQEDQLVEPPSSTAVSNA